MKAWAKKLIEQLDMDWGNQPQQGKSKGPQGTSATESPQIDINEEKATLLYIIDTYNKHLFDIEKHSIRKVRETLDQFAKDLLNPKNDTEATLFRLRQWFSSYRIDEYTYMQNTFDDFKRIVWDFADQLSEDIRFERAKDDEVRSSLNDLREAVESNSIETLRSKSKEFISFYIEYQSKKDDRRSKRMNSIKGNLNVVKKQLMEAHKSMREDHLTKAYNRKSFDEQVKRYIQMHALEKSPVTLLMMDIDHFKKVNDNYGHDIGDFILKECVRMLKEVFHREDQFVARLGGEEFGVLVPDFEMPAVLKKVDELMANIRKEVFVHGDHQIRFTISIGIAPLLESEPSESWLKRADLALYQSKNSGRNKYTVATNSLIAAPKVA